MKELTHSESKRRIAHMKYNEGQRLELANVSFPVGQAWRFKRLSCVKFINVNFGVPIMGGVFTKPRFHSCVFKESDLDGITAKKTTFENCNFDSSIISSELASSFVKCIFTNCTIVNSILRLVFLDNCKFTSCVFKNIKTGKVIFRNCVLKDITFSGELGTVTFTSCSLNSVDFSKSELFDSSFIYCKKNNVSFPDTPTNFIVSTKVFMLAKIALEERLSLPSFKEYCFYADLLIKGGEDECVSTKTFSSLRKDDQEIVMRTLFELRSNA